MSGQKQTDMGVGAPVLAVDLGGTKLLAALVCGAQVLDRSSTATDRAAGPEEWIEDLARLAAPWQGRYSRIGLAVTGRVENGRWWALNQETLAVPPATPFAAQVSSRLGVAVTMVNDAQAAAWAEHLHGAGARLDMVYLTISTGIGGGIVLDGKLQCGRGGLAGHAGQMVPAEQGDTPLEARISGRWIAEEAKRAGHPGDARAVFASAAEGHDWAERIVSMSARRAAQLCRNLQLLLDPPRIVIGGGIGLAEGYLDRINSALEVLPDAVRPELRPAALGDTAGVIGAAALAEISTTTRT